MAFREDPFGAHYFALLLKGKRNGGEIVELVEVGGDGLVDRGHSDEVGTEGLEHADLGRRLVLRAVHAGVDALDQARLELPGHRPQAGRVEVGEIREARTDGRIGRRPGER